ncbi:MAG: ATP-binding cassette domain-containing protein, partial [Bacteroidales bacterium]|nr:ATP-binding cassette domain-containing protein [Bacteroidales bacterium]
MKKIAELKNISVYRKFNKVLSDISFSVNEGEFVYLTGRVGSGKSSLLKLIYADEEIRTGEGAVIGYDLKKIKQKEIPFLRRKIGIVFQDPSLDRELTAYENMYIHGKIYGLSGDKLKKRIMEMLKFVELDEFKDRQVKFFSGGMQRRLEIARALIHEPEVLFLDEPTIGLDPQTRAHIWEYIKRMKEEHEMTIFLTTHYMDEAEQLADRIAVIDHGRI